MSMPNNVKLCKIFNEEDETTNLSVFAMGRQPRQIFFAKNMGNC